MAVAIYMEVSRLPFTLPLTFGNIFLIKSVEKMYFMLIIAIVTFSQDTSSEELPSTISHARHSAP